MPTYGRWDVAVDHGEGCYLYATDGRKFLDFTSGIAVTSLGHCHPYLIEAVTASIRRGWQCPSEVTAMPLVKSRNLRPSVA